MDTSMTPDKAERTLAEIVDRARSLYDDLTFEAVKAWKEANEAPAVGCLPVYAPREVIRAAGVLPVGLMGGGDALEIVKGDAYFQSYICHIPRSTLELGLNGNLDVLDGVIFPSTCDVIRNLSGMWQLLFPDKYARYLDVPQNFDDGIGGRFFEGELRSLWHELAALAGVTPSDDDLRENIALYNENRRLIRELYDLRAATPWQVPSSELYLIVRAGNVLDVVDHSAMLKTYLEAARATARKPMDMARVSVRGCFCEQPPYDLIRTLERSGCYIVDDDWMLNARWIEGDIPTQGDPIAEIARAFLHHSPACPSMYLAEGKKGEALVESVKRTKAEGVIFAAPSFCDPALLDQPMTMKAVKEAGIPCTSFLYAENTGQFQVIREQAGTFADSIKLT